MSRPEYGLPVVGPARAAALIQMKAQFGNGSRSRRTSFRQAVKLEHRGYGTSVTTLSYDLGMLPATRVERFVERRAG